MYPLRSSLWIPSRFLTKAHKFTSKYLFWGDLSRVATYLILGDGASVVVVVQQLHELLLSMRDGDIYVNMFFFQDIHSSSGLQFSVRKKMQVPVMEMDRTKGLATDEIPTSSLRLWLTSDSGELQALLLYACRPLSTGCPTVLCKHTHHQQGVYTAVVERVLREKRKERPKVGR